MDVGFIGLGRMGRPMVERLMASGHRVHIFNRSEGPMEALSRSGAFRASSVAEVGSRSEAVLTALPTVESVMSVFAQLADVARDGQLFSDHSTVNIDTNQRCAQMLGSKGARFLDAPVSGGPAGAVAGTLTVMVGGDSDAFDRLLPIFQAFGKNIRLCGGVGAGQAVKLVNQLLVGINTVAVAEALVFGVKLGANPQVLLEIIGSSFGGSTMMTRNVPRFISRDFSGASPVSLILKDLGIIHDEAKTNGSPVILGGFAEQRFVEAAGRGWNQEDMAAVVKLYEESADTQVGGR